MDTTIVVRGNDRDYGIRKAPSTGEFSIMKSDTILRRNDQILCSAVDAERAVMMSLEKSRYYGLNATGLRIWELLEQPRSVAGICAHICEEFEVDPPECEAAVLRFAGELVRSGIVDASPL
ncbi:MAG TPA: PqqD family protein [Bryobacteraceae bacterium]|nr:PqqD family protein [Bryobacteraceae bacterium]